jgi:type IV secretion system protein TrbE
LGNLSTPKSVQKLQTALHAKAKAEAGYRFYALYDKISREDILAHAYAQCRSNKGAPGVDGQDFADVEAYGVRWLGELALALRQETYRPDPIRRVFMPKVNGKLRPLVQFRRYAGAQIFAFDFGGSIRAAALAMGGDWHDLGGALADDLAEPVALQPLSRVDDAGERAWAAEWVATLLAREAVTVTPELKEHLWSALTSLASAPASERTITGLSVLLQSNALKQALQPYTVGGPWGRLLDAESERLGEAEVQEFETEGLIGAGAAPAVLSYLFHRIELFHRIGDRFDGRPTLLIVDEGWLGLDDRGFARQLREWLKTLRKKNASVIFATQSLADIDGSAIAPAIIESCPTRLFLPNERALEPQIATI